MARTYRTTSEAFKDHTYGAAIERPAPRSLFAKPSFWLGGLASVAVWTVIYLAVTA
jgi:hypothetical protein